MSARASRSGSPRSTTATCHELTNALQWRPPFDSRCAPTTALGLSLVGRRWICRHLHPPLYIPGCGVASWVRAVTRSTNGMRPFARLCVGLGVCALQAVPETVDDDNSDDHQDDHHDDDTTTTAPSISTDEMWGRGRFVGRSCWHGASADGDLLAGVVVGGVDRAEYAGHGWCCCCFDLWL